MNKNQLRYFFKGIQAKRGIPKVGAASDETHEVAVREISPLGDL